MPGLNNLYVYGFRQHGTRRIDLLIKYRILLIRSLRQWVAIDPATATMPEVAQFLSPRPKCDQTYSDGDIIFELCNLIRIIELFT